MKVAMLGRNGLDIRDPDDKYTLRALSGKVSGLNQLAIMFKALRQINPTMETATAFNAEHLAALEMQSP